MNHGERPDEDPKHASPDDRTPDGADRLRPLFDRREAVLKNPAELPEAREPMDIADAVLASAAADATWQERKPRTDAERQAARLRREARKKRVRRQRRLRSVTIVGIAVVVLVVAVGVAWYGYTFGGLHRMPAVAGQAGAATPGQNFLLVGQDPDQPGAARSTETGYRGAFAASDLVMVLHLDQAGRALSVISIPADSRLTIPGHGPGKLADAYAAGGPALYVRTVEELTGVRMDRVMTLDLSALASWTDTLGGVDVTVPSAACGEPAGPRHLDGPSALAFIALRPCLPHQDLDRVAREQALLKAMLALAADGGSLAHPFRVEKLLHDGARNTTVENGYGLFSMVGTLWSIRHLSASSTTFLTAPVAPRPLTTIGGVQYVQLDPAKNAGLWQAVRGDAVATYLQLNGITTG